MRGRRLTTPPLEALFFPAPLHPICRWSARLLLPKLRLPHRRPGALDRTVRSSKTTLRISVRDGPFSFFFLYHYFYPEPSLFSAILYLSYFFFRLCFVFIVIPLPFFSSFYCVSGNKVILARLCAAMVVCFDVKSVPCRLLECKAVVTPANTCGRCLRGFFSAPVTLAIQKLHADMFDGYTLTMRNEHAWAAFAHNSLITCRWSSSSRFDFFEL